MRLSRTLIGTLILSALLSAPSFALDMNEEIDHLLAYISNSPCAFIRNDASYAGAEAADHIRKKYDYFRSDIHSTEDFIALVATKSAMSGRPYLVKCDGDLEPAAAWLKKELAAFRQQS